MPIHNTNNRGGDPLNRVRGNGYLTVKPHISKTDTLRNNTTKGQFIRETLTR